VETLKQKHANEEYGFWNPLSLRHENRMEQDFS